MPTGRKWIACCWRIDVPRHAADFIESLRRKAVSIHTITNYERDLRHFADFLKQRGATIESTDHVLLRDFLNYLYAERRLGKSSVSRKLACLKTFFKFMLREGRLKTNPAELISSPRLPKKLPAYLAEDETATIIEMPQGTSLIALRDRAILELLYASGLRVSELVGLNEDEIDMHQETIRVLGKGNKERIVPFGSFAAKAIEAYLEAKHAAGPGKPDKDGAPAFLSVRKTPRRISARDVQRLVARAARVEGRPTGHPPHPPSQLCNAPPRAWRRPSKHPGASWPREPLYHPEVHPCQHPASKEGVRQGAPQG